MKAHLTLIKYMSFWIDEIHSCATGSSQPRGQVHTFSFPELQLSNWGKNTSFFKTPGVVVKGARNCGCARIEKLRCTRIEPALHSRNKQ